MATFNYPTAPTVEEAILPNPPKFKKGREEKFLQDLDNYMNSIFLSFNDLGISIRNGWLVEGARVISLTADKVFANNIITDNLKLGSEENITLDGTADLIKVVDDNGTTRVRIGKLGSSNTQWGIDVSDASGSLKFSSSTSTFIDGSIISNATITDSKIVSMDFAKIDNVSIGTADIQNLAVTNLKVAGNAIDENKRINVYSQSTTHNFGSTATGRVALADKSFTHSLGRKPTVSAHLSGFSAPAGTTMNLQVTNVTTSQIFVRLEFINLSGLSKDPATATIVVDYW